MRMAHNEISVDLIKDAFSYDPVTGEVHGQRKKSLGYMIGPYSHVALGRKDIRRSRIAFVLMTGDWPKGLVDHVNGDTGDDRWENLREASHRQNGANRKAWGRSRFLGVWPKGSKWESAIKTRDGVKRVGNFSREENAALAYNFAALKYHGEFARMNTALA